MKTSKKNKKREEAKKKLAQTLREECEMQNRMRSKLLELAAIYTNLARLYHKKTMINRKLIKSLTAEKEHRYLIKGLLFDREEVSRKIGSFKSLYNE